LHRRHVVTIRLRSNEAAFVKLEPFLDASYACVVFVEAKADEEEKMICSTTARCLALPVLASLMSAPLRAQSDSTELVKLNRGYVDSFIHGDAAWYDTHLAPEFECLCPNGSIVTRTDFINGSRQPMTYRTFGLDSVRVKRVGDVALITAITPWLRADGTTGTSRYTDVWVTRNGEWKTLQAQITPIRSR
jgi:hypothetical protein